MEIWLLSYPGFYLCYSGFMFKTGTSHVQGPSYEVGFIHRKPMILKKCMSIAKSLTNTQHMELEPRPVSVWAKNVENWLLESNHIFVKFSQHFETGLDDFESA